MPIKLYSSLFSFAFIFIGLGIVLETILLQNPNFESIKIPMRYFYWVFNGITLAHLLLLVIYRKDKNENRRSRLFFFVVVSHFLTCLIALTLYAFIWLNGSKEEALISVSIYLITFVLFMAIMLWQGKK